MKKKDVRLGEHYTAKISGNLTIVRIDSVCSYGGWNATNLNTKREVRIKSAAKLRRHVPTQIHSVVALDSSGRTLGTVFQSNDWNKAVSDAGERNHQMDSKPVLTQTLDKKWIRVDGGFEVFTENR